MATVAQSSTSSSGPAKVSAAVPAPVRTSMTASIPGSAATCKNTVASSSSSSAVVTIAARQKAAALRQISSEDKRRMRFLALLCGRGAIQRRGRSGDPTFRPSGTDRTLLTSAQLAGDNGGKGGVRKVDNRALSLGKGGHGSNANGISAAADPNVRQDPLCRSDYRDLPFNYQPTTPANLSRRILHKSGVGYLDDTVPLIISAMSDRFLATVLVQAMACRDRRLEGRKAMLKERRRRERHRKRVIRERVARERRFREELKKRKENAEGVVHMAKELLEQQQSRKKGSSSAAGNIGGGSGAEKRSVFKLSEKDQEVAKEYRKQAKDVDAEEDYYHSYYGKQGCDEPHIGLDVENYSDDEEDDESDDELPEDPAQYDLKMRDLVRPLAAWGFDLAGKLGFADEGVGIDSDQDGECDDDDEVDGADGEGSDEEEEEDQDDGDDVINSEGEDVDPATTDEEGGAGRVEGKKKKVSVASPIKKTKSKKVSGDVKKKAGGAGPKKKTVKRKREESEEGGGIKSSKKALVKPQVKKAATTSPYLKESPKKSDAMVGTKSEKGDSKKE